MSTITRAEALFAATDGAVQARAAELIELSHAIHATPELAFDEHGSAEAVACVLEGAGLGVERGAYGLETCVHAVAGDGPVRVVVCAEYDALPGIGHGCGHNIIAASAVGAMIALAPLVRDLGATIELLATPAEEHGGGKAILLERGAWDAATFSLMVHPHAGGSDVACREVRMMGVERWCARFTGAPAHAAAAPELGINAGDAAVVAHVALGLLRQQLPDDVRANAITVEAGVVTNIIPGRSRVDFEVRAPDLDVLTKTVERVRACFRGAAIASGCTVEFAAAEPRYDPMVQHPQLARAWDEAMHAVRGTWPVAGPHLGGSTDMGNVSQRVPSIHPYIDIPGQLATPHTAEFAVAALTPAADATVIDAARALARTTVNGVLLFSGDTASS